MNIKIGDKLTFNAKIINIEGEVIASKGEKVTVKDLFDTGGYWSAASDAFVERKTLSVYLEEKPYSWSLRNFVETEGN